MDRSCYKDNFEMQTRNGAFSRTCRRFVPKYVFKKLYSQTIMPSLLYCIPVVWPIYAKDRRKYESTHKYASRLATNDFISSYEDNLHQIGWKRIEKIATERRLLLFYKYHYNLRYLPEDVIQERTVNIRTRATVNLSNLHQYFIPVFTRDRCNKSFFIQSCKLWNDLSDDIINLQFDKFKKAVKRR